MAPIDTLDATDRSSGNYQPNAVVFVVVLWEYIAYSVLSVPYTTIFARMYRRSITVFPSLLFLTLLFWNPVPSRGQAPQLFPDNVAGNQAKQLVDDFFRYGSNPYGIEADSVEKFAIDWFAEYLGKRTGAPFWPQRHRYSVDDVYKIYETDSAAMVTSRTWPDSLPFFGELTVDWVWFLRKNESGEWRIAYVRRMEGLDKAVSLLREIDTISAIPNTVKPDYAREVSTILLSNLQMRQEFERNKVSFNALVGILGVHDSIKFMERTGDRVSQFNTVMIDWGMASEDVPQEVIDEYMEHASPEEREELEKRLRIVEKQKEEGHRALQGYAKKARLQVETLDTVVTLMKTTRVKFINTSLPWKGAVMMTIAGNVNDAMGFLYSPKGELPLISPEEYFYLEDLGNGWWIYRAT